jgi:hypothetical protein
MLCLRKETVMAKQTTGAPTTKVMSGTIGAAVATLIVWVLKATNVPVPEGTEVAITTVVTFLFGYYTPPANGDIVEAT